MIEDKKNENHYNSNKIKDLEQYEMELLKETQ